MCKVAREPGGKSAEPANPEDWGTIREHGLACAISPNGMPDPPFLKGVNNPRYHEQVMSTTKQAMDKCAEFGVPGVIALTGYKWRDAEDPAGGEIARAEGAANSVKALKDPGRHGEQRNVTVCLEMLNTRNNSHPMKGHLGCSDSHSEIRRPQAPLILAETEE